MFREGRINSFLRKRLWRRFRKVLLKIIELKGIGIVLECP
tara:strand:+ start:719 stop:838 length:120 start_codon:yes stop_codon:yes gene_type:complete